jgi:hypothetical protein
MSVAQVTWTFILYVLVGTVLLRRMGITSTIALHFTSTHKALAVYNSALFFWMPVVLVVWAYRKITKE